MVTKIVITALAIVKTVSTPLMLITILILLALLVQKEVASGVESIRVRQLNRLINIAILLLIIVVIAVSLFKVMSSTT